MIPAMSLRYLCLLPLVLVWGCSSPGVPDAAHGGSVTAEAPAVEVPAGAGQEALEQVDKPKSEVAAAPVGSIDVTGLYGLVESGEVLLYDVRPPLFHNLGHIPGSVSLPRKKFEERIDAEDGRIKAAVDGGRRIVLYCANLKCPDAAAVAGQMSRRGVEVAVYHAGWEEWKAADLPTE